MPSPAHETLVALLSQRPDLLDLLLRVLGHPGLPTDLAVADSALRVVNPLEVRPDLVLLAEGDRGWWVILEVQLTRDGDKPRRWIAGAGSLLDARGVMGDVIILTHDASLARWAGEVARLKGPSGTRLTLEPVVLLLTRAEAEVLLATKRPELAVLAAWAVHDQRGADAKEVVREALEVIEADPDPLLREAMVRAMVSSLGDPLVEVIRETLMNPLVIPESPAYAALRRDLEARGEARGRAEGKAEALLAVLAARGFAVDEVTRARIAACVDATALDRWITRAATVGSLDEVFAEG